MRVRAAIPITSVLLLTTAIAVGLGVREKWAVPSPDDGSTTLGQVGVTEVVHRVNPVSGASGTVEPPAGGKDSGRTAAPGIEGPFTATDTEMRLDGILQSVDRDRNTLEVDVHFSTRPDGTTLQLEPSGL